MARGRVMWFSEEKGFGLVEAEEGGVVLVDYTGISGEGFRTLRSGARVEYELEKDGLGRFVASNVREPEAQDARS